jgi:hypothetical protein
LTTLPGVALQERAGSAEFVQVSPFALLRRARMTATVVLTAGLFAAGPAVLTPAHADTTGTANAKVQALLDKVHALQAKA